MGVSGEGCLLVSFLSLCFASKQVVRPFWGEVGESGRVGSWSRAGGGDRPFTRDPFGCDGWFGDMLLGWRQPSRVKG